MSAKIFPFVTRIWGPACPAVAADLVDDTLQDSRLEDTLRRFALGEIEPAALAWEIQVIFETNERRRLDPEPDAMDARALEVL